LVRYPPPEVDLRGVKGVLEQEHALRHPPEVPGELAVVPPTSPATTRSSGNTCVCASSRVTPSASAPRPATAERARASGRRVRHGDGRARRVLAAHRDRLVTSATTSPASSRTSTRNSGSTRPCASACARISSRRSDVRWKRALTRPRPAGGSGSRPTCPRRRSRARGSRSASACRTGRTSRTASRRSGCRRSCGSRGEAASRPRSCAGRGDGADPDSRAQVRRVEAHHAQQPSLLHGASRGERARWRSAAESAPCLVRGF